MKAVVPVALLHLLAAVLGLLFPSEEWAVTGQRRGTKNHEQKRCSSVLFSFHPQTWFLGKLQVGVEWILIDSLHVDVHFPSIELHERSYLCRSYVGTWMMVFHIRRFLWTNP